MTTAQVPELEPDEAGDVDDSRVSSRGGGRASAAGPLHLTMRGRAWPWVLPALLATLTVTGWPLGRAVWESVHRESVTDGPSTSSVGVDNYRHLLTSGTWWQAVGLLAILVVAVVLVQVVLGLAVALVLDRLGRTAPLVRLLVLVPFGVVSVVSAFAWLAAVDGGYLAEWFGFSGTSSRAALAGVGASEAWRGTGVVALILLAGLSRVPRHLVAGLVADGATPWQVFSRVLVPAMRPALAVAVVWRVLDAWRAYDAWIVARPPGASDALPQSLIVQAFVDHGEVGLGGAMSVLLVVLTGLLGLATAQLVRRRRLA